MIFNQLLPLDIIEEIGSYCDIDGRRCLGLKPRKIDIKKYENLLNQSHISRLPIDHIIIQIPNSIIQFEINRHFEYDDYVDRFYIRRNQGIMKNWYIIYISIYVDKYKNEVKTDISIGGGFRFPGESTLIENPPPTEQFF